MSLKQDQQECSTSTVRETSRGSSQPHTAATAVFLRSIFHAPVTLPITHSVPCPTQEQPWQAAPLRKRYLVLVCKFANRHSASHVDSSLADALRWRGHPRLFIPDDPGEAYGRDTDESWLTLASVAVRMFRHYWRYQHWRVSPDAFSPW